MSTECSCTKILHVAFKITDCFFGLTFYKGSEITCLLLLWPINFYLFKEVMGLDQRGTKSHTLSLSTAQLNLLVIPCCDVPCFHLSEFPAPGFPHAPTLYLTSNFGFFHYYLVQFRSHSTQKFSSTISSLLCSWSPPSLLDS